MALVSCRAYSSVLMSGKISDCVSALGSKGGDLFEAPGK